MEHNEGVNILSLDGGGFRGLVSLLILKHIEEKTNKKIRDIFHLVCGTSTGGIIALAIQKGTEIDDIIKMFEKLGADVFDATYFSKILGLATKSAKYNSETLERELKAFFDGNTKIEKPESYFPKAFVVTSDCSTNIPAPFLFKSYSAHSPTPGSSDVKIWEALRATSAAPTYFEEIIIESRKFKDGGLTANNPSLLAIKEANAIWPGRRINFVLSVGTGMSALKESSTGIVASIQEIIQYATDSERIHADANDYADGLGFHYCRLNPSRGLGDLALDKTGRSVIGYFKAAVEQYLFDREVAKKIENLAVKIPDCFRKGSLCFSKGDNGLYVSTVFQVLAYLAQTNTYESGASSVLNAFAKLKVVIVYGRVGSGKSSLINMLTGKSRLTPGHSNESQTRGIDACITMNHRDSEEATLYLDCEGVGSENDRDKLLLLFAVVTKATFIYNIRTKFEGNKKDFIEDLRMATLIAKELKAKNLSHLEVLRDVTILQRDFIDEGKSFRELFNQCLTRDTELGEINQTFKVHCFSLPEPVTDRTSRIDLNENRNLLQSSFLDHFKQFSRHVTAAVNGTEYVSGAELLLLWTTLMGLYKEDDTIYKQSSVSILKKEFIRRERQKLETGAKSTLETLQLPVSANTILAIKKQIMEQASAKFAAIGESAETLLFVKWLNRHIKKIIFENLQQFVLIGVERIDTAVNRFEIVDPEGLHAIWQQFANVTKTNMMHLFESETTFNTTFETFTQHLEKKLQEKVNDHFGKLMLSKGGRQAIANAKLRSVTININPLELPQKPTMTSEQQFSPQDVKGLTIESYTEVRKRTGRRNKHKAAYRIRDENGNVIEQSMGNPSQSKIDEVNRKNQEKINHAQQKVNEDNNRIKEENAAKQKEYDSEVSKRKAEHDSKQRWNEGFKIGNEIGYAALGGLRSRAIYLVANYGKVNLGAEMKTLLFQPTEIITDAAFSVTMERVLRFASNWLTVYLTATGVGIPFAIAIKIGCFVIQALLSTLMSMYKNRAKKTNDNESFHKTLALNMTSSATSRILFSMVAKFIPLGVLVDSLVDLAQALIARFELQEKMVSLVVKAKKTQNSTEPSISTNINNLTFADANTVNDTPEELYSQRKRMFGLSDMAWATAKNDSMLHCLAFVLFKKNILPQEVSANEEKMDAWKVEIGDWIWKNKDTVTINTGENEVTLAQAFPNLETEIAALKHKKVFAKPLFLWAVSQQYDVDIYEIQSIPQLEVICYGGDKTRDESHSVYIGTIESNGLCHYPLYFAASGNAVLETNTNSNDTTNNTNVMAPVENINEPDVLPGNEDFLDVINQIEGPGLSMTRELMSFQKQIKDFEDSYKDPNVDNNTIDQQASRLDEIIEKLNTWQMTYPENKEISTVLTRATSLLKLIEDGEEDDAALLQADPQFL